MDIVTIEKIREAFIHTRYLDCIELSDSFLTSAWDPNEIEDAFLLKAKSLSEIHRHRESSETLERLLEYFEPNSMGEEEERQILMLLESVQLARSGQRLSSIRSFSSAVACMAMLGYEIDESIMEVDETIQILSNKCSCNSPGLSKEDLISSLLWGRKGAFERVEDLDEAIIDEDDETKRKTYSFSKLIDMLDNKIAELISSNKNSGKVTVAVMTNIFGWTRFVEESDPILRTE